MQLESLKPVFWLKKNVITPINKLANLLMFIKCMAKECDLRNIYLKKMIVEIKH